MFKRLLIANRGEIALRVIRACRDLGIRSVAVFSEGDRGASYLAEADQAVCIGPARSRDSYLNMAAILQAAEQTECGAIHPGYGFLSENALFAEMCAQAKMTFIGPPPRAIRLMGDKAVARSTMRELGLPVIPGSEGALRDLEEGRSLAEAIGYPVLLKASAGGGGRGMRRVDRPESFDALYREAEMEADKAFGDPRLYLEKYIVDGRHIEFQVMADHYGSVVHLGERECSAQRRHQKLLEEAPSTVVTAGQRRELGDRICRALAAIGYANAGTVEFFRDAGGALYFMEMNTRLQVEHPVTEMITGRDLVVEQIRIACHERLSFGQDDLVLSGHAIECRINAEDPWDNFRPAPGLVSVFEPPVASGDGVHGGGSGDGAGSAGSGGSVDGVDGVDVRVDTHLRSGSTIPSYYDSLMAKLIVRGRDRAAARAGLASALRDFRIEGVKTTIPVHLAILGDERFAAGDYDTGFVERLLASPQVREQLGVGRSAP